MQSCNWKCLNMNVCASIYMFGRLSKARTCYLLKTGMSDGIYHPYQLNEPISNCWVESFNFIQTLNSVDAYQTTHSVASGLGLYFFDQLEKFINDHNGKTFMVGGDFNTAINEVIDRRNGRVDTHKLCRQAINNIIDTYKLTPNKSSHWLSLRIGHLLYLIFAKSISDTTLKFCIYSYKALIICLPYQRLAYYF